MERQAQSDLDAMSAMMATPSISSLKEPEKKKEIKTGNTEDLFSAHNFDITIDLDVPIPSKSFFYISVIVITIDKNHTK